MVTWLLSLFLMLVSRLAMVSVRQIFLYSALLPVSCLMVCTMYIIGKGSMTTALPIRLTLCMKTVDLLLIVQRWLPIARTRQAADRLISRLVRKEISLFLQAIT